MGRYAVRAGRQVNWGQGSVGEQFQREVYGGGVGGGGSGGRGDGG